MRQNGKWQNPDVGELGVKTGNSRTRIYTGMETKTHLTQPSVPALPVRLAFLKMSDPPQAEKFNTHIEYVSADHS